MYDQPNEEHQPWAECPIFDADYQKDSSDNDGCEVKQDYYDSKIHPCFLLAAAVRSLAAAGVPK
jgi:hypothetical protein